ncbi:hypothetical protein VPHD528_0140 [Vibrio phage D528]
MEPKDKLKRLRGEFYRLMNLLGSPIVKTFQTSETHYGVVSMLSSRMVEDSGNEKLSEWRITVIVIRNEVDKVILSHDPSGASCILSDIMLMPSAIQTIKNDVEYLLCS